MWCWPGEYGRRAGAGAVPDDHLAPRPQDGQDEERGALRHLPQVRLQTRHRLLHSAGAVLVYKVSHPWCPLQVYVPLYIIVMSSWVTFWLVKTEKGQETPARWAKSLLQLCNKVSIRMQGFHILSTRHPTSGQEVKDVDSEHT